MLLLTKSVFAVMIGFLASTFIGLILIPKLKKMHAGQHVSVFLASAHKQKEGTPTMGGLIFILSTTITILLLIITNKIDYTSNILIVLLSFLGFGLIGFIDDFLSLRKKGNEGLTTYQKLFMQVIISVIFFYIYMKNGGQTSLTIGTLHIDLELGWLYGLFILFVLVASSNAVNLTDGLDGLAGGLSAIAYIAFALISLIVGYEEIGIFSLILSGSILGFLVFNSYPAKVIMGDTGSLALGAAMGAIAIITHRELTLVVVAGVFVIETFSVIIQTISVVFFHKKVFLMSPLHHHFEKLGWKEPDIVKTFWIAGLVLAMSGIIFGVWL